MKLSGRLKKKFIKEKREPSGLQHPLSSSSPPVPVALINEFIRAPNLHSIQMTSQGPPPLHFGVSGERVRPEGNPQESV